MSAEILSNIFLGSTDTHPAFYALSLSQRVYIPAHWEEVD